MSTVILKWNPGFSSYTMVRFLKDLEKCALANDGDADMNWSVWEHERVHKGDTFYMLKVGYGQTGIVAKGTLTSEPYSGEDWSWRNRPTMYCDFNFGVMINPDAYPILDSRTLSQAIPDFDWNGGHSGMVVTEEQANILDVMWSDYMQRQAEYFEKASDHNLFIETAPVETDDMPYTMELNDDYSGNSVYISFKNKDIMSTLTISNLERIYGKFGVRSWRALRRLFMDMYPTTESLQTLCSDLFKRQIEFEVEFYKQVDD